MDCLKIIRLLQDIHRIFWMYPIKERDDYMQIKRVNIQIDACIRELEKEHYREYKEKLLDNIDK